MYKLLIADDELLEHQAIRYFIENSTLDIDEIFSCMNGLTAVETALAKKPDIIILDMKMPVLSGLEAMERIISVNKNCKIIFSSAYNYFEYAVKSMQLGAMDYIVKPVKKDTLINVLNKAIDLLDSERIRQNKVTLLDDLMGILENKIFYKVLQGEIDEEVLFYLDAIGVSNSTSGNAFLIHIEGDLKKEKQKHAIKTIKEDLEVAGYKCIVNIKKSDLIIIVFLVKNTLQDNIVKTVKVIVESVFRDVKSEYLWNEGNNFNELSEIHQYITKNNLDNNEQTFICENNFSEKIQTKIQIKIQIQIPKEIEEVCNYIHLNYMKKITLDTLVEEVGISKFHLSRLFTLHKKMTVIDYLTQTRINKAKELLKQGGYSIKQISYMTGYSEPNYFSWAFKKSEGVSPVKYKYSQQ